MREDVASRPARRGVVLAALVGVAAFFYRFNTLGGAFGGFTNDEFGYLARAQQILAGELPFRDFNDPGWFLTDVTVAAAQWAGGATLRAHALLTITMLALAAAITFALARRASGSAVAALLGVALQVTLSPRPYNFPKIFLYAAGIALAWRYVDRPTVARAFGFGAFIAVAFLFRHDHLLYVGALGVLTIILTHWRQAAPTLRSLGTMAAGAAICVAPFLVFLELNGGTGEYLRTALIYARRDAQRTGFSFPRLTFDRPVVSASFTPPPPADVRVNVEWAAEVTAEQRTAREQQYRLTSGERRDGTTWNYRLDDRTPANIERLVRDPLVLDTHGVNRQTFAVASEERSTGVPEVRTVLDTVPNATAFLYYTFLSLPFLAAALLLRMRSAPTRRVMSGAAYIVPLIVLAALLNVSFMSRGSTNIRLPDVTVTMAVLSAWITRLVFSRDLRTAIGNRLFRWSVRLATCAVIAGVTISVSTLEGPTRRLDEAGFTPFRPLERASFVWEELGRDPRRYYKEGQPEVLRLTEYINKCTLPTDRLFVLSEHPELHYFADRRFAGGHAWLLPFYYSAPPDEERIVKGLRQAEVPIVVTEGTALYESEFKQEFDLVDAYLRSEYTDIGDVQIGEERPMRLWVRADRPVQARYPWNDLPCLRPLESPRS